MNRISLAEAAMLMRCSYLAARDRLLRGEIEGGRDGGRFWVLRSSAERFADPTAKST